jgi:hypothetical protein
MKQAVRKPKLESLKPTIGGSTYLRPQEIEWTHTQFEKTWIKVLYEDKSKGEMTCLLKLEPGAHIPFHKHAELEQTLVLEGSVYDHDGKDRGVGRQPGSGGRGVELRTPASSGLTE